MDSEPNTTLTIGKVANLTDVGVETIRFYEREGLLASPPRTESGYRSFPKDTVARIRFIKRAKDLGFSLKEIRDLLSLRAKPSGNCAKVQHHAMEKIEDINRRISSLKAMRRALEDLVAECSGTGPQTNCPILNALDAKERQ